MNHAIRLAYAQGMGDLGDGPWVDPSTVGEAPPLSTIYNPSGGGGFNWNQFAQTVGGSLVGIFGNRNAQQQPVYYAPNAQQQQPVYNQQQPPGGVGIGIDGQGIRLSDGSHIGWFPIIGVIGAFYLIQSPGFTRRR